MDSAAKENGTAHEVEIKTTNNTEESPANVLLKVKTENVEKVEKPENESTETETKKNLDTTGTEDKKPEIKERKYLEISIKIKIFL